MPVKIITFLGKTYSPVTIVGGPDPKPIALENLSNTELADLYNLVSSNLGRGRVKRFADSKSAFKRTWAILNDYSTSDIAMDEAAANQKDRPFSGKSADTIILDDVDQRQITNEAASRKPVQSEQLIEAAASAGAKTQAQAALRQSPPASDNPAKDAEMPTLRKAVKVTALEPKKRVYARKAGSKQAILVDLLGRSQGATFGELYDGLAATGKPWRGVTIRSGLAWDINHIAGYGVTSELLNGEEFAKQGRVYEARRLGVVSDENFSLAAGYDPDLKLAVYRLVYPAGMDAPVPHIEKKA